MDPYSSHRLAQQFAFERDRLARQLGAGRHSDLPPALTAPRRLGAFRRAGAAARAWLRTHASRSARPAPGRARAIELEGGGPSWRDA